MAVGLKMIYLLQTKDPGGSWRVRRAYTMEETANRERQAREKLDEDAGDHNTLWTVTPMELEG